MTTLSNFLLSDIFGRGAARKMIFLDKLFIAVHQKIRCASNKHIYVLIETLGQRANVSYPDLNKQILI
jgi:hypothetical protein